MEPSSAKEATLISGGDTTESPKSKPLPNTVLTEENKPKKEEMFVPRLPGRETTGCRFTCIMMTALETASGLSC